MKKLFLIFALSIFSMLAFSQQQKSSQYEKFESYETEIYQDWLCNEEPEYYGEASFYYAITRSTKTWEGYYIFDVWLYSNSYVWDYDQESPIHKSTYVNDNKIKCNGEFMNKEGVASTFKKEVAPGELRFYSKQKHPEIIFYYGSCSIP